MDVLGFDPSKVTRDQIAEAYEITTSVMRGEGNNFAVLSDFNEIITPQMVVPTK